MLANETAEGYHAGRIVDAGPDVMGPGRTGKGEWSMTAENKEPG